MRKEMLKSVVSILAGCVLAACGDGGSSGISGMAQKSMKAVAAATPRLIFSPYKDITISMNWNTNVISTNVTGSLQPILNVMPSNLDTLTWAFATGECGSENWGGLQPAMVASANVQNMVNAGKKYILSTGGAAGSFTCSSDAGFQKFIQTYYSANLVGVDFDIEAGQSQDAINNLVQRVINASRIYPQLRFSFTLATLGGNSAQSLNQTGAMVMNAIKTFGLTNYTINLMTMDYGSANPGNCVIGSNGLCDMGKSAIQAAVNLHNYYGTPYSQIELTPMIGGNDTQDETFTLADVNTISSFAQQNSLAGIHFWSFDRDNDCPPGYASPTCNSYGQAGTLGFTKRFLSALNL
ncbi:chitinase [Burkholderia sp. TSV86]|uniref:chitinase n=1 Tax=Burkholderia sp. TSV86 TaxID=1385594 RepID=UPI00075B55CC|nr:chitinase [Burkholderia sp. TSV86]KVE32574.1 glycosyl hydrolase [Burkholderia sp. TSV86]